MNSAPGRDAQAVLLGGIKKGNILLIEGAAGTEKQRCGWNVIYRGVVKFERASIFVRAALITSTFGNKIMNTNQKQDINSRESDDEQKPVPDRSPDEKLGTAPRVGSVLPGTENPDSEIKQEKGPNTE